MAFSASQLYLAPQMQQAQQMQYQPSPAYPSPYAPSPSVSHYANSLISAYGQLPAPPLPIPQQTYVYESPSVGAKRSSEDVIQAVDLLSKRPRPDSGGTLGFYPQRPGEKMCAFYMTTRTCSFGHTCKYDHPVWVPYGGIPNWKEVTGAATTATTADPAALPQRIGEQNCSFYMKTGDCKYGPRCKFNHPKDRHASVSAITQFKDEASPVGQNGTVAGSDTAQTPLSISTGPVTASSAPVKTYSTNEKGHGKVASLNSKGLPLRQNETDCTYYIKTGSCKYGATCRFHHPEVIRTGTKPAIPVATAVSSTPLTTCLIPSEYQDEEPEYGTSTTPSHPQRPGGQDCTYYLKTGECSFGATCKFHHPANRQPSSVKAAPKLTLAGLPRREGETVCAYYMKTGSCKYESTCRFDHPPPGEVAAKAAAEASRKEAPSGLDAFDLHQAQGLPMHRPAVWPWLSELQQSSSHLNGTLLGHKAPS